MSKQSLLLVDGDARSLRVLEVSLRKVGFTVTTAINGPDALDKLALATPDLVISETKLDEMDGFELCRRIRGNPLWADIPFVFLTAQNAIEHKVKGLELGVDDYLTKPIYIKEVVTRLQILLQKRQRARIEERRDGRTRFVGRLSDMAVVDLIQTIEISRKSGVITFTGEAGKQAAIYFRDGKVVDAEAGPLQGEDAVYRLLTWNDGAFEVVFRTVRRRDVITTPSQGLLMEGMRRLDEWTRLCEQLPPLDIRFEVDTRELSQRLGDIPDENNTILKLMDGRRTLTEVIDACSIGDLECLQAVSRLYFEGLLVEVSDGRPLDADRRVVSGTMKEDSAQWVVPATVFDETPVEAERVINMGQRTPSQRVVTVPQPTGREGSGPKPGLPPAPRRLSGSGPIAVARTDSGPIPHDAGFGRGQRADTEPGRVALAATVTENGRIAAPPADEVHRVTTPAELLERARAATTSQPEIAVPRTKSASPSPDIATAAGRARTASPSPESPPNPDIAVARVPTPPAGVALARVTPTRIATPVSGVPRMASSPTPAVARTPTPNTVPAQGRTPSGEIVVPRTRTPGLLPDMTTPTTSISGFANEEVTARRQMTPPQDALRAPAAPPTRPHTPTPTYGTPAPEIQRTRTPATQIPRVSTPRAPTPAYGTPAPDFVKPPRPPTPPPVAEADLVAEAPAIGRRPTPLGINPPRPPASPSDPLDALDALAASGDDAPEELRVRSPSGSIEVGALAGQFRPSGLRKIDEAVLAAEMIAPELFADDDAKPPAPADAPAPAPSAIATLANAAQRSTPANNAATVPGFGAAAGPPRTSSSHAATLTGFGPAPTPATERSPTGQIPVPPVPADETVAPTPMLPPVKGRVPTPPSGVAVAAAAAVRGRVPTPPSGVAIAAAAAMKARVPTPPAGVAAAAAAAASTPSVPATPAPSADAFADEPSHALASGIPSSFDDIEDVTPARPAPVAELAAAAAAAAATNGGRPIRHETNSGRMVASHGADQAQVSGELRVREANEFSEKEITHREIVTIKPRRITREMPAVVPSPELLEELGAGDTSTTIPAAKNGKEAPAMTSTAVERVRAPSRPPRAGTGTTRVPRVGWLPWIFGAAGLALMAGAYVRCQQRTRTPVVAPAVPDAAVAVATVTFDARPAPPPIADATVAVAPSPPDAGRIAVARPIDARVAPAKPDAGEPGKPGYKELRDAAADALRDNDPEAALEYADQSIAERKNARAYVIKADALRRLDRSDDAIAAVDAALDIEANLAAAWEMRGKILWAMRRTDEARQAYEKYLELKPDGPTADRIRELLGGP